MNHIAARPLDRKLFLSLVETAQFLGQHRFVNQACLAWLAAYPGDLPVNLIFAQALSHEKRLEQASAVLTRLCQADPEDAEAAVARLDVELRLVNRAAAAPKGRPDNGRAAASQAAHTPQALVESLGNVTALKGRKTLAENAKGGQIPDFITLPAWGAPLRLAREALRADALEKDLEQAQAILQPSLAARLTTPLVAVTHLRLLRASGAPAASLRNLAEFHRQRWPECLQFQLLLAEALMESGDAQQAVSLLHQAASRDVTGQTAVRLWGEEHPYRSLWPEKLELALDMPIPAVILAALGWNHLPQGDLQPAAPSRRPEAASHAPEQAMPLVGHTKTEKAAPLEELRSVQAELDKAAARLGHPALARADGRFPAYIILSTRRGLEMRYGYHGAEAVLSRMERLVESVRSQKQWSAHLYLADQGLYEVPPARQGDPWAIKLALADLDVSLARRGEMIGALLIVGGPDVVPFHRLPNPVDDADDDVPSDNPYGTRDENYFIPEWAVGRLPGGAEDDPQALIHALEAIAGQHAAGASRRRSATGGWRSLVDRIVRWFSSRGAVNRPDPMRSSFGYTAAAWKRASQLVFQPIGEARALQASPPLNQSAHKTTALPPARLAYFNLHGLVDAPEWFGQSEVTDGPCAPDQEYCLMEAGLHGDEARHISYPVALRPQDVLNSGRAPQVVFSEACYGAHIENRRISDSLALKFLQSGSQAVVGSTCTAYGAVSSPLTAADFLGHAFWSALRQGIPAGESLRRAKIALAREMHNRQGYLDGEDQKTLISFVLYGDPLAQPLIEAARRKSAPSVWRTQKAPAGVRTVCDRLSPADLRQPVPAEVLGYVKSIVEQYLPGMEDADIAFSSLRAECGCQEHRCPTGQLHEHGKAAAPQPAPHHRVVTLSKQVVAAPLHAGSRLHRHYARLTLNEENRLVKLVVSR
jgi:hypothetical protein